MPPKYYPTDVITQAEDIRTAWSHIDMSMTFGELDFMAFSAEIEKTDTLEGEVNTLRTLLLDRINQRNAAYASVWDKVKRVRSGVKGNYGDDSRSMKWSGARAPVNASRAPAKPLHPSNPQDTAPVPRSI